MAGAWESQPNVLVAILHTDLTYVAWALGLRALQIPGIYQKPMVLSGMPYDHARNMGAMRSLDVGADFIFFLDSDVVCPPNIIHRLLAHNKPLVSGMYCRRSPPHGVPVMMKPVGHWLTNFKRGSLVEVDVVGTGCLLVSTDIFRSMKPQAEGKHWFHWRVDMKGTKLPDGQQIPDIDCLSEDFTFCMAVKKQLGVSTFVDTSIVCRHVGAAEAGDGTLKPLDCVA